MRKNCWIAALAMAVSGAATATAPVHPDNTEIGSYYHGAEFQRVNGKFVRVDAWATPAPTASNAVLEPADGWRFVGGEAGWELEQHSYAFVGGRLVHNDRFRHDTPKPPLETQRPFDHVASGG
jgi:hypothetical protein